MRELGQSRCGLRAGKSVKWATNKMPWGGVCFFKTYHFFQKNHVGLNISKHKNEIFPFFDMKDPKVSYNYILFNIFVQEPI
jgi:hypothetical protein